MEKQNPYTGITYECRCDYSYTCGPCEDVRRMYAEHRYREELEEWAATSLQKIAAALGIQLEPKPQKPEF